MKYDVGARLKRPRLSGLHPGAVASQRNQGDAMNTELYLSLSLNQAHEVDYATQAFQHRIEWYRTRPRRRPVDALRTWFATRRRTAPAGQPMADSSRQPALGQAASQPRVALHVDASACQQPARSGCSSQPIRNVVA